MHKRKRMGGPRVAYPGKVAMPFNVQLTKRGHDLLRAAKRRQKAFNWKGVKRLPSAGDIYDGLLDQFGDQLVLPAPTRPK